MSTGPSEVDNVEIIPYAHCEHDFCRIFVALMGDKYS